MRILKVVQAYYPFRDRGGPVVKVRSLAHGLAKRGHSVTVLTADLGLTTSHTHGAGYKRCRWGWQLSEEGVAAIYLPTIGRYRALTLNPGVLGFCRSSLGEFDLVHLYGLYDLLGPVVGYFCRRRSIPYVIEPMGMFRPIDRAFRMKQLWHANLGCALFHGAARVIATSEMEQQELLEQCVPREKLALRYNGVDSRLRALPRPQGAFRKRWNIPADQPLILFMSRLIPRKGADMLIDAFAQACPESGRLVISGPEGESGCRAHLERCAKEARIEARVVFTGPLYDEDKQAALTGADLFVLPSRYENFANAAAEAIACGVPVIISDSCGIHSLVRGRAGLVIKAEKNALAEALRTMISDAALYQRLKDGCGAVAEQLDWGRLSEQMEGHYLEALPSNGLGPRNEIPVMLSP
jgi:glycosyltransferase involved in cell wall biosynthesis